jgi:hypothetical protein
VQDAAATELQTTRKAVHRTAKSVLIHVKPAELHS